MNELKQHIGLLSLIALLSVAKFIIVPIFDWQETQLLNIQSLLKKQSKIERVLAAENDNKRLNSELIIRLTKADKLFFPYQADSAFKLSQQKMLESLIAKYKLRGQNFGWQTTTVMDELSVTRYQLQVQLRGASIDMIEFIIALELIDQRIEIGEFSLSFKRQAAEQLGTMQGRLVLFLYVNDKASINADRVIL